MLKENTEEKAMDQESTPQAKAQIQWQRPTLKIIPTQDVSTSGFTGGDGGIIANSTFGS